MELADETALTDFIDDGGADITDKDAIGFVVWEGDPNALAAIYQFASDAFVDTFETAITVTNMTLGIKFDGVTTVSWWVDGVVVGSITDMDLSVYSTPRLFPEEEELSPLISMKQGAADVAINFDWIKFVGDL